MLRQPKLDDWGAPLKVNQCHRFDSLCARQLSIHPHTHTHIHTYINTYRHAHTLRTPASSQGFPDPLFQLFFAGCLVHCQSWLSCQLTGWLAGWLVCPFGVHTRAKAKLVIHRPSEGLVVVTYRSVMWNIDCSNLQKICLCEYGI